MLVMKVEAKGLWRIHSNDDADGKVKIGDRCNEEDSEVYKWMKDCVLDLNVHANYDCM